MSPTRKVLMAAAAVLMLLVSSSAFADDYCCSCKNGKMRTFHGPGWKASMACVALCGTNGGTLSGGRRCDHDSKRETTLRNAVVKTEPSMCLL